MGTFRIDCEIEHIRTGKKATVKGLLVGTGAELTWLPQEVLARIGTAIAKKDQQFIMANGQTVTRSIGYVILRAGGFETVDEAVFGQPGDMSIFGSHTLEGFGATVDPRRKKLVAAGPYPAAAARVLAFPEVLAVLIGGDERRRPQRWTTRNCSTESA
ncbi:MAG: hypothetical protein FJ290_05220 [Planctomycetes bacterium]|nr:hypothetical protein [Planctomycetota bacterium]